MLGPFDKKPISLHISRFMTREKPDSEVRRTIVDLSWLKNFSVNAGVMKDKYLGSSFVLNYPSVDDIVKKIVELGLGSLLYEVDISRAFKQLKVDPGDLDILGLKHQSYFIDQSVPFRYGHGSVFFDTMIYIMRQQSFPHLYNYVDDLIYCRLPSNIYQSFETLLELLTQLGFTINRVLVPAGEAGSQTPMTETVGQPPVSEPVDQAQLPEGQAKLREAMGRAPVSEPEGQAKLPEAGTNTFTTADSASDRATSAKHAMLEE